MKYPLLDKLTLVIFTYNRHKYLKRTIHYWSNYNVNLVILDGSEKKIEDQYIEAKNIKYLHNKNGLHARLLSSINLIETEFMIIGGDDEFYLPSALSSCIKFLLKETSYYSCGGRAVGFRTKKKKLLGIRQYPQLKGLCLDYDSASDRIYKHFSSYVPAHFYSVMRSAKWDIICRNVFKKKYNFYSSEELQLEFLVIASGKSKIISELMWMRNNEVARADPDLSLPIEKFWYDKKNEKEKNLFLQRIKKACNELSTNQNSKLNEKTISNLFEVFAKKMIELRRKNLLRKILTLLPEKIEIKLIKFIKKFYKIAVTRGDKSLVDEINALKAEGTLVNSEEIKKIISILIDSKSNDSNIY